jgi:hypothetical protein
LQPERYGVGKRRNPGPLFHDDAVRPFHQRHEDRRVAELGSPLIQI